MLQGARKDTPTVTPAGTSLRPLPAGVEVREVHNLVTRNGVTTEVYRSDWATVPAPVAQALYVSLREGAISAWHCHETQLDRVFVVQGSVKLVLYDGREGSPSQGAVCELFLERARPSLVTIPPGVWHGMQNVGSGECAFLNFVDPVYEHGDPDEWRLPPANDAIPYRF
jgi:dTDP-4-dehydrorhamnose 3,5-epimerase